MSRISVKKSVVGKLFPTEHVRAKESAKGKALIQILILKVCETIVHADNKIHMDMAF